MSLVIVKLIALFFTIYYTPELIGALLGKCGFNAQKMFIWAIFVTTFVVIQFKLF